MYSIIILSLLFIQALSYNRYIINKNNLQFNNHKTNSFYLKTTLSATKQSWFNKAIVGTLAAIQIIVPTVAFNPSPSLADSIPLVGTKAPDFTLPSNAGY